MCATDYRLQLMTQHSGSSLRRPGDGERPRSYKTEAIVLRSRPMREADRLITVLTPNLGKLPVTVRGARRINSRLGGHLDAFNHVHLTLAIGHHIDVVTGAESIESFGVIKANLERLATSLYLMELADALLPDASPHPGAYTLLLNALRALNEGQPVGGVARYTELRLLEDSGYLPELGNCQVCGAEITPGHHKFAPGLGGVVDDTCDVPIGQLMLLSLNALKILRHYRRSPMAEAVHVGLSPVLHEELERVLGVSIHYVLEREMASSDFIDHLNELRNRAVG
jgi:DNA repair protein RecO (recombination protein O)